MGLQIKTTEHHEPIVILCPDGSIIEIKAKVVGFKGVYVNIQAPADYKINRPRKSDTHNEDGERKWKT